MRRTKHNTLRYGYVSKRYFKLKIDGKWFATYDDEDYAFAFAHAFQKTHPKSLVILKEFCVESSIHAFQPPLL